MSCDFFMEQSEQSLIKTKIVTKYFFAWSKVILRTQKKYNQYGQKMAYIDLFAGPGKYADQSKSTPLLVLEKIISDPVLSDRVVTLFNDKDINNINSLQAMVAQLDGINKLKYPPKFSCEEVGSKIVEIFQKTKLIPAFFFVDPWGYKGLSLDLISSIIKDWGCDCVFFFNYNRVNMGINNEAVKDHMISLFGEKKLDILQNECQNKSPEQRERIIVESLCESLRESRDLFVLPFKFKSNEGTRTSHHLFFLSKDFRGYDIMKDIMHKESSDYNNEIASFGYNPRDQHFKQGSLFDLLSHPLDELKESLKENYAGRTIDFRTLYEEHSANKPYVKKHYKKVLKELLKEEKISAINIKTGKLPRVGTFSDDMTIIFRGEVG